VERALKERLIGAAVLVAVAIILIPEMLSGPGMSGQGTPNQPDPAVKTPATIKQPAEPAPASVGSSSQLPSATETLPAIANSEASASDEADLKSYTIDLRKSDPQVQTLESAPQEIPATAQKVDELATPTSTTAQAASSSSRSSPSNIEQDSTKPLQATAASGSWAVQLASLATRASADQMVNEIKKDGFGAFVMPFESKGKTLYRVRLGPFRDRPSAESAQAKVKRTHSAATVVPHP
jgi:DedD protein